LVYDHHMLPTLLVLVQWDVVSCDVRTVAIPLVNGREELGLGHFYASSVAVSVVEI
jgi:hypothetical protein